MNKCILFPPRWSVAHPYLSLPCLTAYLNQQDIKIDQYDLNLEEFNYFMSIEFLNTCLCKILNKNISNEYKEIYRLIYNFICDNLDEFKFKIRDLESFLDFNNYKDMNTLLEEIHNFISVAFDQFNSDIDSINFDETLSIKNIKKILTDNEINPYIDFSNFIIKKENLLNYEFVAISVVIPNQIIPMLSLCYQLKKQKKNIHICIGGSCFSKIYYKIDIFDEIFKYFDSILMFEGEETLSKLILNLENDVTLENIPNLIYKDKDKIIYNDIKKSNIDLELLPPPIYGGLKLKEYASPEIILPYFISRSCYWGKCSFCDHDFGHDGKYRIKSVKKVIEDILILKNNYGSKYIYFVDEAIPPGYLDRLCDSLILNNVEITWFTCIKASEQFTEQLCEKMKKAGCVLVFIGIESCSEKVLNDMNKGITLKDIEVATNNLALSGIWVHGFLINDFPTEDFSDKMKTILKVFNGNIHSVGLSEFVLTKNSKIITNNLNFNLKNLKEKRDFSSMMDFEIEGKECNNSFKELANIYSKRIYNRLYPNEIFLREHLPIFLKHYNLVSNKAYLKSFIMDENLFDKKHLLYKEECNKTIIYNLKSKGAFSCEYNLKNLLDKVENINSAYQIKNLIAESEFENYEEIEEIMNLVFDYEAY